MTETYWCPGAWPWEWFRTCTREVPDDPCATPPCVAAKAKFAEARQRFINNCDGLRITNAVMNILRPILSTPLWVIVVAALVGVILLAIGGVIGGVVAVVIWGLIAIWGLSWLLMLALGRVAQAFAMGLGQARTDLQAAMPGVISGCPDQCRGDLSIPVCKLE